MRLARQVPIVAVALVLVGPWVDAASAQTAPNPYTRPPALGPVKAVTMPGVVERRLPNGLRLLVVEHHELPVVDLILVVRTGSEADPRGKEGLATLVGNMLDEGAAGRTTLAIAEQASFLGVQLGTSAGLDQSRVTLHTPVAQLDSALALMADITLRPDFPAAELERLRQERLTALLQLKDRAPAMADQAYMAILYGPNHPYGQPTAGTEASVGAITRDDVVKFYQTYYRPNDAAVVVVGDVRPDDVQRRLERALGAWPQGRVPKVSFPAPPVVRAPTIYLIDKPRAAQSSFRMGTVAVSRSTPDFFPIQVMNTILGGAFTSRLNQNLRETRGFTYGAQTGFDMRRDAGPFTARAEIVTEKSDSAMVEFIKELRGIREPVPQAELDKAKSYVQLSLPGAVETTSGIAARLATIALYDLPLDFLDAYSQRIQAVSQADVLRVARQYVRPDAMDIVVVGDLAQIEPGIRALGVGEVVITDVGGRPVVR